eukprot:CAMPEP_0194477956 /NCGR_PEP_ID=MMETSP0253-20130528/1584_1 /TAXON_ID=2966 /ORGANISM="Noctiluca scintillans" /LENGTH=30 /DNA_ID= /DNA_START= /DNA_END= /DNA_ORIENTATION=
MWQEPSSGWRSTRSNCSGWTWQHVVAPSSP